MPRCAVGDLVSRVLDLVRSSGRPYAVFVGRSVDLVPADGPRFAKLQQDAVRMALCVGVFDGAAQAGDVAAALVAAGGA